MQLVLTRRTSNTVSIEILNDEGEPQYQTLLNRFRDRDIRWLSTVWGEDVPSVTAKLNEVCEVESDEIPYQVLEFNPSEDLIKSIVSGTEVIKDELVDIQPFTLYVRELSQLQSHSVSFSEVESDVCLSQAFCQTWEHSSNPSLEFIIEWADTNRLVCLDIDYHALDLSSRPDSTCLSDLVSRLEPKPFAWHPSHGKGAKLYYTNLPGYTAKELASIAGLNWIQLDSSATFDLTKSTRHPFYNRKRDNLPSPCNAITYLAPSNNLAAIKRLLTSDIEWADVEAYLSSCGFHLGQILPHSECPIDPTNDHKSNVYVGDKGFFCHRCAAKGLGSIVPGFTSYASLIGCNDTRLATMVRNFCHLEHARVVLSNLYPTVATKILEDIYRVMLKIVHSTDDPRIQLAMRSGTGFIRINGLWVSVTGDATLSHGIPEFVRSLPATMYVKKQGKDAGGLSADVSKTVAFLNDGDLTEHGYPDISFLRGCKIFGHYNRYPADEIVKVVIRKEFARVSPKWIPLNQRMNVEEAWQLLEHEFPGISRNYVKLLIATKGASEGRLAQCPFLLISGPSGAGKSTTVHIAAGLCGDKADEPIWNANTERFRMALMDGVKHSGFICVNEVFKYADNSRLSYTQALDPMLSLTEDSRSHVMYVGSIPFGRLPVFVLTDINIPPEVVADRQLARRFVVYRLDGENQWAETLVHRQIRPHQFRLISPEHNAAADSILSDVIDTYFREPIPLQTIAESLSITTLQTYSEDVDRKQTGLLDFYNLVLAAPSSSGIHAKRYSPLSGWKVIDRLNDSPLMQAWSDLSDGVEPHKWSRSRLIDGEDWSRIVGTKFPIMCEYRSYKNQTVYIRFRSTDSTRAPKWVNGV